MMRAALTRAASVQRRLWTSTSFYRARKEDLRRKRAGESLGGSLYYRTPVVKWSQAPARVLLLSRTNRAAYLKLIESIQKPPGEQDSNQGFMTRLLIKDAISRMP